MNVLLTTKRLWSFCKLSFKDGFVSAFNADKSSGYTLLVMVILSMLLVFNFLGNPASESRQESSRAPLNYPFGTFSYESIFGGTVYRELESNKFSEYSYTNDGETRFYTFKKRIKTVREAMEADYMGVKVANITKAYHFKYKNPLNGGMNNVLMLTAKDKQNNESYWMAEYPSNSSPRRASVNQITYQ